MSKFVLFALWMMVKGASFAQPALLERQAASSSATTTSSSASPSSTPFLVFVGSYSFTTCTAGSLRWVYSGPQSPLSLTITNINVTQIGSSSVTPSSSSTASRSPITDLAARAVPTSNSSGGVIVKFITTGADPMNDSFTWDKVNVPQGWYTIWATMEAYPDFSQTPSSAYFVSNGSDVSCLLSSGGSSSSSSPSSTVMSSRTSSTTSPSPTAIVGAVSSVNKGAIAGGVVGGVALLSAVLAALLYFLCASQRRRRTSTHDHPDGGAVGRWGTLGSFDSTHSSKSHPAKTTKQKAKTYNGVGVVGIGGYPASSRAERHHSQPDSLGPIVSYGHAVTESPVSEEGFNPYAAYEDKHSARFPASLSDENGEELVMTPTMAYSPRLPHAGRQSTSSIESYVLNNNFSRPRSRDQAQRMPPSPEVYPESPSTSSVVPAESRRFSSPVLPVDDGVYVGYQQQQQSLRQTPRRMPRKPVPSYNPSDLPEPLPAHLHSSMTSLSHTPSPAHSVHSLILTEDVHQLIHKGSFSDGRPVHVLMPDLPPPQRN
ncbi:hypothetical protein F5146DRAFT_1038229 [Armillaria mellea]|nr:hypothetical protein F5146DRAFT_1038229 [Armillaria mellea]